MRWRPIPPRFLLPALLCVPAALAAQEIATEDAGVNFKSKVNLVMVPVVVRDRAGKPVGDLRQEDFRLFDNGKLQIIAKFSVEHGGARPVAPLVPLDPANGEGPLTPDAKGVTSPDRFVAYVFDDIHLSFPNLVQARDAAEKHLASDLRSSDRAAVFTTSGQVSLDFTDDRASLHNALLRLRPNPIARTSAQECPDIPYHMADMIRNHNDPIATGAAVAETVTCMHLTSPDQARPIVDSTAARVLSAGNQETRVAMLSLKDVIRRMSSMPGQRVVVFASPGFPRMEDHFQDETEIIEHAVKGNVVIGSLDARGLYTDAPDASRQSFNAQAERIKQQYVRSGQRSDSDVLAEIADGTGGLFIENTNDLASGFDRLSSAPEVWYLLGFSPQNLKLDGSFHALKITLRVPAGLNVKARRGYYAPRHLSDADEDAKEEISQALFSRDEMSDIPVDFHTQFFKSGETQAHLVVLTHLDVRKLHYRKAEGRNDDDLVVVSGLFDRNGNFLQGVSKTLKMRLRDDTLQTRLNGGVNLRSEFNVPPGTYVIRLVVRDAEGQMMAARNGAVEIP